MVTYIQVSGVLLTIGLLARVFLLAFGDYPRKIEKGPEVVQVVFNLAWLVWAVVLLSER